MIEAVCNICGKKFMTDFYSACGPCLAAPIARGVDAAILNRVKQLVPLTEDQINDARRKFAEQLQSQFPPDGIVNVGGHTIDLSEFRKNKTMVETNQAKRRADGDSREPDGTTWRDRPPLF